MGPRAEPDFDAGQVGTSESGESPPQAGSAAQAASGNGEPRSEAVEPSQNHGERQFALQRERDEGDNATTRPPPGEAVTCRSVTVAEVYVGQQIDRLTDALAKIKWADPGEGIVEKIAEARNGDQYFRGRFWLISETGGNTHLGTHGRTSIPVGIDRIYAQYYVVGPSIVALVMTFALDDDAAKELDSALRNDAESRLDRPRDGWISVKTVEDVKKERVRWIRDDFTQRGLSWLKDWMPGSLSASTEGPGSPAYALVTLAEGRPFETDARYMSLLDLKLALIAWKFAEHDFVFLTHPLGSTRQNNWIAAFNEAAALNSGDWLPELYGAPEVFHEAISSLVIADALDAVLASFEPRLRDVRADLGRLNLAGTAGTEVVALRNRLLGISREVSMACSDVSVLVANWGSIWRDISPLTWLNASDSTPVPADSTAEAKKRQLRATMEGLQTQEADLRDLILVTSQSLTETRNLDLQAKVVDLTDGLRCLTRWLIVLTVVLVVLGVATLLVTVANSPGSGGKANQTSHPASPSPAPSSSPMPSRNSATR